MGRGIYRGGAVTAFVNAVWAVLLCAACVVGGATIAALFYGSGV